MDSIQETVYGFKTKYDEGYTNEDIKKLLKKHYPHIPIEKLRDKIGVVTCMMKGTESVIFHTDIALAVRLIEEDRDMTFGEWD